MKKKIILCLGMLLGFSFGVLGCNTSGPSSLLTVSGTEIPSSSNVVNVKNEEPVIGEKNITSGLQYFDNTFEGFSKGQGYYRVLNNNEDTNFSRISYIDFESKVEIPLCNQPQCSHDTEKCQAMFYGNNYMNSQIFPMGDKIYVLASKNAVVEDLGIENGLGMSTLINSNALYEMNIDGTNRSEIVEIGAEYELHNTIVTGNGKILIAAAKQVPDAVVVETVILQIDVSSGELSELDVKGIMCGVVEDKVVISQTGYGNLVGMSDSEAMSMINKSSNTIITYNSKTKEVVEHGEVLGKNLMNYYVYNNRLIYASGNNAIYNMNLDTNEIGTIIDQLQGRFYIYSVGDGKVVCSFDDGADVNAMTTKCLMVDCETGEASDFTLFTRQSVNKHGVAILGASDTKYLVKSDLVETSEYIEWAGVNQVNMIGEGFSLINKDDYWASKDNYEPITTLD